MKIFISGGCKNGKSYYAQRLAKALQTPAQKAVQNPVPLHQPDSLFYIATMRPVDAEDSRRIARHRSDREGWGFITVEQHIDIEKIISRCDPGGSFLLDSLTALLANEMFPPDGSVNDCAADKITCGLVQVMNNIGNIVIVSDYIYSDGYLYDPLTIKYMKSLARIDRTAAQNSDIVLEISYTNVIVHKGMEAFGELYETIP